MKESVIYQDILLKGKAEGKAATTRQIALSPQNQGDRKNLNFRKQIAIAIFEVLD